MPIKFACHHCGAVTDVSEQYIGQSGPCAHCGQIITIPLSPEVYAAPARPSRAPWIIAIIVVAILAAAVMVVGILAALLLPAVGAAREAGRRAQCLNTLKQIGLAMHNYHDANHHFPPAYTVDKDGKPLQSWRVLLLPFLDDAGLYQQFKLDEPWNSPSNRVFANNLPPSYRCPSDSRSSMSETSYLVVGGPGTMFDGSKSASLTDLRDPAHMMLVIELPAAAVDWTEPKDIDVRTWDFKLAEGARRNHLNVVNVLFADGHVESLSIDTDPQVLRQLCTGVSPPGGR